MIKLEQFEIYIRNYHNVTFEEVGALLSIILSIKRKKKWLYSPKKVKQERTNFKELEEKTKEITGNLKFSSRKRSVQSD